MNSAEIENLINEEKVITDAPKKEFKEEGQHLRSDFELATFDNKRRFSVFIRINKNFRENFSIGLIYYLSEGGSVQLIRLNGNHGEVVEDILKPSPHFGYHIHKITPNEFERGLNEPKFSHETKEYASYEQAILYFCKSVNIKDAHNYFDFNTQLTLFQ